MIQKNEKEKWRERSCNTTNRWLDTLVLKKRKQDPSLDKQSFQVSKSPYLHWFTFLGKNVTRRCWKSHFPTRIRKLKAKRVSRDQTIMKSWILDLRLSPSLLSEINWRCLSFLLKIALMSSKFTICIEKLTEIYNWIYRVKFFILRNRNISRNMHHMKKVSPIKTFYFRGWEVTPQEFTQDMKPALYKQYLKYFYHYHFEVLTI